MIETSSDTVKMLNQTNGVRVPFSLPKPTTVFLGVVVLPTLIATAYLYVIATPQYVSEARFVVRQPQQDRGAILAGTLSGIGLGGGDDDTFIVHEYLQSHEAVTGLGREIELKAVLAPKGVDFLSKFPRPWESENSESLNKAYRRHVLVGYDATTGVTTLRVKTFDPQQARQVANVLLSLAEMKVNALNERSSRNGVKDAERMLMAAESELLLVQQELSQFRNDQNFIDPQISLEESSKLISTLVQQLAILKAERRQIVSGAPQSPLLAEIDQKIRAFEEQVTHERSLLSGGRTSLASKVGLYQALILKQELADRYLGQAKAAQIAALEDQRRQNLYIERVVDPSLPDAATEPRRFKGLLTVLMSALMLYGLGWLVWAGIKEHRQT